MRDLERKVNRYVKERAKAVTVQKSRGNSPMVNSMFSPSTGTGFNTTAQSSAKITKKVNNRTFSMTVVFNPQVKPRFDVPKSKDIAIYHQHSKQKSVSLNPFDYAKSPKRNPILQNGEEPAYEFKAPLAATPFTNKMTIFDEEQPVKKKGDGQCKGMDHARSFSPPVPCVKTFYPRAMREDISPENPRRIRKGVANSLKNILNPITEGDMESLKFRRVRKGTANPGPSEETKNFNDKKKLLSTEIGYSPKGRVFRDSSLVDYAHPIEDPTPVKARRFGSPQLRKEPEMQGILAYSYSKPYRADVVSPKCTSQSFYDVCKGLTTSHMF